MAKKLRKKKSMLSESSPTMSVDNLLTPVEPAEATPPPPTKSLAWISVNGVREVRGFNSREPDEYDEEQLRVLAESIRAHGQQEPIHVKRDGVYFDLIAGHRRLRAMKMLGEQYILAVECDGDIADAEITNLVENVIRRGLSPLQISRHIRKIRERKVFSDDEIAAKLGRPGESEWVVRMDRLMDLDPTAKALLQQDRLSVSTALELVHLTADQMKRVCRMAEAISPTGKLSLRTMRRARKQVTGKGKSNKFIGYTKIADKIKELEGNPRKARSKLAIDVLKWVTGEVEDFKV